MIDKILSWLKGLLGISTQLSEEEHAENLSRIAVRREGDALLLKEGQHAAKSREGLGELVATIHFQVQAAEEEVEYFPDGIIPWISIEKRHSERDRLIDRDEIVFASKTAKVLIDYPLDNPTSLQLKSDTGGLSRWQLIDEIGRRYEEIYDEEETSAETKTLAPSARRILNRNQTDGTYGIWGHDLGDLAISLIEVRKNRNGEITLWLGMES